MKLQEWQEIKEEFGDEAYNRLNVFCATCDNQYVSAKNNIEVEQEGLFLLKTQSELAQHDTEFYGINQYFKMWQWRYADGSNDWQDCNKALSFNPDKEYRRKQSAALSFDLERAKAGDVMLVNRMDDQLFNCKFIRKRYWEDNYCVVQTKQHGIIEALDVDIFMKYPQRIK